MFCHAVKRAAAFLFSGTLDRDAEMNIAQPRMPRWRSLLFVPAHVERFVTGAHKRHADVVILDLEELGSPRAKA